MSVSFKSVFKLLSPIWNHLETLFFYFVHYANLTSTPEIRDRSLTTFPEDVKLSPEETWDMFLLELDHWFNDKQIRLSYALSAACATTAVRTGIYVLEDADYNVFCYYDTIIERIKKRYLELAGIYFNDGSVDFTTACRNAEDHVMEELYITEKEMYDLKKLHDFNEQSLIDAV